MTCPNATSKHTFAIIFWFWLKMTSISEGGGGWWTHFLCSFLGSAPFGPQGRTGGHFGASRRGPRTTFWRDFGWFLGVLWSDFCVSQNLETNNTLSLCFIFECKKNSKLTRCRFIVWAFFDNIKSNKKNAFRLVFSIVWYNIVFYSTVWYGIHHAKYSIV